MSDVFEQPWTLLGLAIVVFIALWIFRAVCPSKKHWWQWLLPTFLALAAFGLDVLVQTDLEKINSVIRTAVKAVEEENPDAIETIISANYHDSHHNTKRSLMKHCRARLVKPLVKKNIKRIVAIDISSPKATAIFTVRIVFDEQSSIAQNYSPLMFIKIKAELQKEQGNKWLINRVEILEIDRQPANWKDIR